MDPDQHPTRSSLQVISVTSSKDHLYDVPPIIHRNLRHYLAAIHPSTGLPMYVTFLILPRPSTNPISESCKDFKKNTWDNIFSAVCNRMDGSPHYTEIDLNQCLINDKGTMLAGRKWVASLQHHHSLSLKITGREDRLNTNGSDGGGAMRSCRNCYLEIATQLWCWCRRGPRPGAPGAGISKNSGIDLGKFLDVTLINLSCSMRFSWNTVKLGRQPGLF